MKTLRRLAILDVRDVAESQLCSGCGACAYLAPQSIEMIDTLEYGRRPRTHDGLSRDPNANETLTACPGYSLTHDFNRRDRELIRELIDAWGPVREVWEGHAADRRIRFAGSSGGAATALALYCIERLGFHGVLHIAAREDVPYLNQTVMSYSREELLARTGSRYAPASPCDGLQQIEDAPAPCVFIGKPCDVAATRAARRIRPRLDRNLGLTIAFFCAGTPTTKGTLDLLRHAGVEDPSRVESVRYRGNGWPGRWTVCFRGGNEEQQERSLSYEESWGFLTKYVQWRCRLCPDHTGEFADIALGDPWYRRVQTGEAGKSLIVARTRRGLEVLREAAEAGYLVLEARDAGLLPRSQPNLLSARGAVWGRLLALRLAGVPGPRFRGMPMLRTWLHLPLSGKVKSILGTFRRIGARGLRRRQVVQPLTPADADPPAPIASTEPQMANRKCP